MLILTMFSANKIHGGYRTRSGHVMQQKSEDAGRENRSSVFGSHRSSVLLTAQSSLPQKLPQCRRLVCQGTCHSQQSSLIINVSVCVCMLWP